MNKKDSFLFQVNLKGMIELLSEHIYSSPTVFIRELLQNGVDAITARRVLDESHVGQLDITITPGEKLVFQDNGIGLSEKDVHEFLSVIGQSSKRGDLNEKDFIGKFGIGLLSCFVVSDKIVMESHSLKTKEKVRWIGRPDGTYDIEKVEEDLPIGTRVILTPKDDYIALFEEEELVNHILYYGNALPNKVTLHTPTESKDLVDKLPVWLDTNSSKEELLEFGEELFNVSFLDVFRFNSEETGLSGVGFIMPHKANFKGENDHLVYLKRMFLCENPGNLLPDWSSFVKCVINTSSLKPTASRESLMDNKELRNAKNDINSCFKDYLKVLALQDQATLMNIVNIHHLYIKAMAAEDSELLNLFINYIPFETNKGRMTFGSIVEFDKTINYTCSLDDFRQIRRIAGSQGQIIINAAYSFESDLIRRLKIEYPGVILEEITPHDVLSKFGETEKTELYVAFEKRVNEILEEYYCKAQIRSFEPDDTPAIYVINEEALNNKGLKELSKTSNPFAPVVGNLIKETDNLPTICLNKNNQLIQDLVTIDDDFLLKSTIDILYVQSLMLGGYPVNKKEMNLFNEGIYQLLVMGMSNFSQQVLK